MRYAQLGNEFGAALLLFVFFIKLGQFAFGFIFGQFFQIHIVREGRIEVLVILLQAFTAHYFIAIGANEQNVLLLMLLAFSGGVLGNKVHELFSYYFLLLQLKFIHYFQCLVLLLSQQFIKLLRGLDVILYGWSIPPLDSSRLRPAKSNRLVLSGCFRDNFIVVLLLLVVLVENLLLL